MEAIYRVEGANIETSAFAAGPWDPGLQHGAAPSSLICWAVEQIPSPVPMRVARLTVDLMRPVPVAPLTIETEILREGKKIQLVAIRLLAEGKEVVRATALRIRKQAEALPIDNPHPPLDLPLPEGGDNAMAGALSHTPFLSGLSARNVKGAFGEAGPAAIWFHAGRPIVDGATITPLMRAAITADFCNGTSAIVDFRKWTFINGDLTLSLAREPVGEMDPARRRDLGRPRFDRHRRRPPRRPRRLLRPRGPERAIREALIRQE
jgi:hypothetical protein